jgi:hypothetical protein
LALLLTKYLDPDHVLDELGKKPSSRLNGILQKKRGMRSGVPDAMVIFRQRSSFIEVKSRSGRASRAQKQVRDALVAIGCEWRMCRSARAALTALHQSGVEFRRPWRPVPLRSWEGPFSGAERRLPQLPEEAALQREACRRWRERRRALAAAERYDGERAA